MRKQVSTCSVLENQGLQHHFMRKQIWVKTGHVVSPRFSPHSASWIAPCKKLSSAEDPSNLHCHILACQPGTETMTLGAKQTSFL